jgi:hypothetical protein
MRPFCLPYFYSNKREEFTCKTNRLETSFYLSNLQQAERTRGLTWRKATYLGPLCVATQS